tara:strand:- start:253 stop:477 length:225 start_codon:yes stop_codon:yes gene_type:complete
MKLLLPFISLLRFFKRNINLTKRYNISEWMELKSTDRNSCDINDRLIVLERKKALIRKIRKEYQALEKIKADKL